MNLFWRLVAFIVSRRPIARRLIWRAQRTPYFHLTGYMERWWLFNPYAGSSTQQATAASDRKRHGERRWPWLPSIRIHHILRADTADHPHDHPWDARTIILEGGYFERRHAGAPRIMRRGDTVPIRHGDFHHIEHVTPGGVWTLFITWDYQGSWGFLVNGKKVPWRVYETEHQRHATTPGTAGEMSEEGAAYVLSAIRSEGSMLGVATKLEALDLAISRLRDPQPPAEAQGGGKAVGGLGPIARALMPKAQPPSAPVGVEWLCRVYADAYHAGHHATVEGNYVDVLPVDRDTYWREKVEEDYPEARARQPAPVAPVGVERKYPDDGNGDDDAYNRGWNDCLDALAQQPAPVAPVGAAEDMVLDAIERRESSAPVGVEGLAVGVREREGGPLVKLAYDLDEATEWAASAASDYRNQNLRAPNYSYVELVDRAALAQQPAAVDESSPRLFCMAGEEISSGTLDDLIDEVVDSDMAQPGDTIRVEEWVRVREFDIGPENDARLAAHQGGGADV